MVRNKLIANTICHELFVLIRGYSCYSPIFAASSLQDKKHLPPPAPHSKLTKTKASKDKGAKKTDFNKLNFLLNWNIIIIK